MKTTCLFIFASALLVCAKGLRCWTCENARSVKECRARGRLQTCLPNEQFCQSEIRRDPGGYRITKRCKQDLACENNLNNARCGRPKMNSVCRCCCNSTGCNTKGMKCRQQQRSPPPTERRKHRPRPKICPIIETPQFGIKDCSKVPENKIGSLCRFSCIDGYRLVGKKASKCLYKRATNTAAFNRPSPVCKPNLCQPQESPENGGISCTNGASISSTCTFTCDKENGYELYPSGQDANTCQRNRFWSNPKPCCVRSCPKYALVDLMVLLDSSSSIGPANWRIMKEFISNVTSRFTIAPDSAQISVVRYNKNVDTTSKILLNSVHDQNDFTDAYSRIPYGGTGTNTGDALLYVYKTLLKESNGNRPNAPDVLLVVTDGNSQDSTNLMARKLRRSGVNTYALGINPIAHNTLDKKQLLRLAGSEDNVLIAEDGFSDLDLAFSKKLSDTLCNFQCQQTFARGL